MKRSRRVPLAGWFLGGSFVVLACSLTVPDEDELFQNGDAGDGGTAGSNVSGGGGIVAQGGNAGSGGKPAQMGGEAGTWGGGGAIGVGGESGEAGHGGSGGSGAQGGSAGSGGDPATSAGAGAGQAGLGGEGGGGPVVVPFEPNQGLLMHYRFDDTAGTAAYNEVSAASDGVINGTSSWVAAGKIGGALRLSGQVDSFVDIPPGFMTGQTEMSVAAWFNQDARALWARVFDFGTSASHWMYFAPATVQVTQQGARAALDVSNFIAAELHMAEQLQGAGQWVHVVVTWSAASFACYINGVLAGEEEDPIYTPGDFASLAPPADPPLRAWIGRSSFYPPDPHLAGMVDDFRVYDRALTAADVASLHALTE